MIWTVLTFLFGLGALALHVWWRGRFNRLLGLETRGRAELAEARESNERAALRARAHQQALFDSMVEGVLLVDESGKVRTTNPALLRLFEIERDVRGLTVMEAFHSHELLSVVERVRAEGEVRDFEFTLPGLQHTRHLELNAATLRGLEDTPSELILIFHDYSRIKELENLRKEFVANVSHELRTPLTLIKGYVETLIDGAKDDPAVAEKFLRKIERHANRLTYLIEDLLTISHLESGRLVVHPQDIPAHPLVERVLDELQSPAAQKKVTIENRTPADQLVYADGDRLQQVLFNLVDNAIKHGRPGGSVSVRVSRTERGTQFAVQDDGPGIPAEALERVFERFYRVDRARSREQGGTGLGLSIVKHIVQAHGGEVWVESELERGSTFFFSLPDGPAASATSAPA